MGLRSHYVSSVFAAPLLLAAGAGQSSPRLVANISSFGARVYALNVAYGVGKAGVDRLASDMAHDFKPLVVAELAVEYGFTDIDGTQPKSLREKKR